MLTVRTPVPNPGSSPPEKKRGAWGCVCPILSFSSDVVVDKYTGQRGQARSQHLGTAASWECPDGRIRLGLGEKGRRWWKRTGIAPKRICRQRNKGRHAGMSENLTLPRLTVEDLVGPPRAAAFRLGQAKELLRYRWGILQLPHTVIHTSVALKLFWREQSGAYLPYRASQAPLFPHPLFFPLPNSRSGQSPPCPPAHI